MDMNEAYRELESGFWAEMAPAHCPCGGSGWMLSNFDIWHKCLIHYHGTPHPEFDYVDDGDYEAARLEMYRGIYAQLRAQAFQAGFRGEFNGAIAGMLSTATPADWVNCAYEVVADFEQSAQETEARKQGYSCGLEMRRAEPRPDFGRSRRRAETPQPDAGHGAAG